MVFLFLFLRIFLRNFWSLFVVLLRIFLKASVVNANGGDFRFQEIVYKINLRYSKGIFRNTIVWGRVFS